MYQLENSWLVPDLDADVQAARDTKRDQGEQTHNNHYQGWLKAKKPCRDTAFKSRFAVAFPGWSFNVSAASVAHGLVGCGANRRFFSRRWDFF